MKRTSGGHRRTSEKCRQETWLAEGAACYSDQRKAAQRRPLLMRCSLLQTALSQGKDNVAAPGLFRRRNGTIRSSQRSSNVPWGRGAPRPEGAMSKLNIRIAVIVLVTLLSAVGYSAAKGDGGGPGEG